VSELAKVVHLTQLEKLYLQSEHSHLNDDFLIVYQFHSCEVVSVAMFLVDV
jgi:hypothetical protein